MNDLLKKSLTLSDALKISKPLRFNMMFKPIGSICNLNCSYCYYMDKHKMFGSKSVMTMKILEKTIRDYIEVNDSDDIVFDWHGGEPLLLGLDFFVKVVELQRKYMGDKRIFNTVQTNATLMNDEFASFFKYYNFLVGVSIDGPEDIHDKYRKYKNGNNTFKKVLKGIEILKCHDVDFNTLTTINRYSEGRGNEVYEFLKSIGSRYMQFMPVLECLNPLNSCVVDPTADSFQFAHYSVNSLEYGKFMCDVFDIWVKNDVGSCFVNLFDSTLANWCGLNPGTCVYSETCGANLLVEHNGDMFPCDHFVYEKYKLGNLKDVSLEDVVSSLKMKEFGINKRNTLPSKCLKCKYYFACHGECPKHRFDKTDNGEVGLNSLCEGLYYFFSHVEHYMEKMKTLFFEGKEVKNIMDEI